MRITKALIVAEPWIGHLLTGRKSWEMRSKAASLRGWFGLIRKGSGAVVGVARLVDVGPRLTTEQMLANVEKHCIPPELILSGSVDKWTMPWKLEDVQRLPRSVPYQHKSGAVTWVDLDESVTQAIADQFGSSTHAASVPLRRSDEVKVDIRERGRKLHIDIEWDDGLPEDSIPVGDVAELAKPKPSTSNALPSIVSPSGTRLVGEVALTEANITHGHIYLRSFFDRFPADAIGGSNKASQAKRLLTVQTPLGDQFETDLDGKKRFFRARGAVRSFLESSRARAGDVVVVEEVAPYRYRLSLKR